MQPGEFNAITDVPGVRVGHTTLIQGVGKLRPGAGPIRTGVTAVLQHPGNLFQEKVPAAIYVINGFGKCMGREQVDELGVIDSPIMLTNTTNVGRVIDAVVAYSIRENPSMGITTFTVNPIVGETSDSYLNDVQGRHVREEHVLTAIDNAASGPVVEGCVGGGTGMSLFEYKGGIGTASRVLPLDLGGWTVGVLVQGNYGLKHQLVIDGVRVGEILAQEDASERTPEQGSIMFIVATDAPLNSIGLKRLAKRCALGLGRTGSIAGHNSGDYVIAFSNAESARVPAAPSGLTRQTEVVVDEEWTMDPLFQATVEATEEAIVNAMFKATTMAGRDDHVREALPLERVEAILSKAGRLFR
jgi:D-aminopeptidase